MGGVTANDFSLVLPLVLSFTVFTHTTLPSTSSRTTLTLKMNMKGLSQRVEPLKYFLCTEIISCKELIIYK